MATNNDRGIAGCDVTIRVKCSGLREDLDKATLTAQEAEAFDALTFGVHCKGDSMSTL